MVRLAERAVLIVSTIAGFVLIVNGGVCPPVSVEDNNDTVMITRSQYCFVNNCSIRIKHSNMILSIFNNTGDWIMATNTTNLLIAPNNGTECTSSDRDTVGFIFLAIAGFIIILSSSINTFVHIIVKELHTVTGAIIIALCSSINALFVFQLITAIFQYFYPVHNNRETCGAFKYGTILFLFMYEMIKVTYLMHFGYLMYRSYRVVLKALKNRSLLYLYTVIILVGTFLSTTLLIVVDLTGDKSALSTTPDGYCDDFFNNASTSRIILLALIGIMTLLQVIIFVISITFYVLVTKNCCGKGLGDARVSIILMSTIGLNVILTIVLLLAGVEGEATIIAASVATCVEQVTLLIVFMTYKKVRRKLCRAFVKTRSYSITHSEREVETQRSRSTFISTVTS